MPATVWKYCQINFQITNDSLGFTSRNGLGSRVVWIRFIAQSENKTIATSKKVPVSTLARAPLAPLKGNIGHEQVLFEFLETLKIDNWELVEGNQGEWWHRRLRKAVPFKKPEKPKLSLGERMTMIGATLAIIFLGFFGFSNGQGPNPLRHYTKGELKVATGPVTPAVGPMVIIDVETRKLDPIQTLLPPGLAVEDLTKAETVVWLDCDTDSNWRGATTDCLATLIDWESRLILEEREFEGEFTLHPTSDEDDDQQVDIRDHEAIVTYLANLPRK